MKKKVLMSALGAILVLMVALCAFVACNEDLYYDTYKVTFMDGDFVVDIAKVEVGKSLSSSDIPQAPEHPLEIFDGWFYNGERLHAGYQPTGDIVAMAQYHTPAAGECVVTFSLGRYAGSEEAPNKRSVTAGQYITLPDLDFEWEQYEFLGWSIGDSAGGSVYQVGSSYQVNANVTFVAQWKPLYPTLHFETNGGTEIADITGVAGSTIEVPQDPVKDNRTFAGWYTSADFSGEAVTISSVLPEDDITYYAKFVVRYTVKYLTQNETMDGYDEEVVVREVADAEAGVTRDEYKGIIGFTLVEGEQPFTPVNDKTYEYKYDRRSYNITYKFNLDLKPDDPSEAVEDVVKVGYYGLQYTVEQYEDIFAEDSGNIGREYRYKGWSEQESDGEDAKDTFTVDGDVTLYAQYYSGIVDFGGGNDLLFLYDDGTVHLDRPGIEDKATSNVQVVGNDVNFTFDEVGLSGKISLLLDGFAYFDQANVGSAQLFGIMEETIYTGATLVTDGYYGATLTVTDEAAEAGAVAFPVVLGSSLYYVALEADTYEAYYMYDSMLGDRILLVPINIDGTAMFARISFEFIGLNDNDGNFFAIRGLEAGTYYEYYDEETDETSGDLIILDGYGNIYRQGNYFGVDFEFEGYYMIVEDVIYAEMEDTTWGIMDSAAILRQGDIIGAASGPYGFGWYFYTFEYGHLNLFGIFEAEDDSTLFVDGFGGAVYIDSDGVSHSGTLNYEYEEMTSFAEFVGDDGESFSVKLNYNEMTFEQFDGTLEMIYWLYTEDEEDLGILYSYSDGTVDMYAYDYYYELVFASSGKAEDQGEGMYAYFYTDNLGMLYYVDEESIEDNEGIAIFMGYVLRGTFNSTEDSKQLEFSESYTEFAMTFKDSDGQSYTGTYTVDSGSSDDSIIVLFESKDSIHSEAFVLDITNSTFTVRQFVEFEVYNPLYLYPIGILRIKNDNTATLYETDDYGDLTGDILREGEIKQSVYDETIWEMYEDDALAFRFKYDNIIFSYTVIVVEAEDLVDYAGEYTCEDDDTTLVLDSFGNATYTDEFDDEHIGRYFFNDKEDGFVFMCGDTDSCDEEFEFTPDPESWTFTKGGSESGPNYDNGFRFSMDGEDWLMLPVKGDDPSLSYADIYQVSYDDYYGDENYTLAAHGYYSGENYIFTYTVTEIVDDMLLDEDFAGFQFRFGGGNEILIYDEASHVTYTVTGGGELALDGFGSGSYTDADGEVYIGEYEIQEDGSIMFFWLEDDYSYTTIYFTINGDGTVTTESEPTVGLEAGEYQIVNMYAGWGYWIMELDGLGNVSIYTHYDHSEPDAVGTYTIDIVTSYGSVHITEALTVDGQKVKDFKFVLVTVSGYFGYVEANDDMIDRTFEGDGWSLLTLDGYLRATYVDKFGYTYTGNYAYWKGAVYFYPGNSVEWIFMVDTENNTFKQVEAIFYYNDINSDIKLVITDGNNAYLDDGSNIYKGTVDAEEDGGILKGEFISDDGDHSFEFSANVDTGIFSKKYDISGSFSIVNDSWYVLGDYIFQFYSGYNGGQFMVYDEYSSLAGAGTYALKDKANLLWTITFSYVAQPFTLRELGEIKSGSSFDVYVETGYGENRLVVYNADIVGIMYKDMESYGMRAIGFYGNGYGWYDDTSFGYNGTMMQYYFFDDEFGGYVYIDEDGYPAERWFLLGEDMGAYYAFEYLDAHSWSSLFGKYYNVDNFNEYITLDLEASMLGVVSCPWRKVNATTIYVYVPDRAGFYTKHTVTYNADKGTLTYDGHEYSKTFSKEVTLTNAQNWTITFNVVDLEKNTAGYTVASATLTTKDGKSIELYFGYYTVGSVQYGNLKYYWYVGFYVDIAGGAGQSFLRFEVTTDLDPETFEGTQFEFVTRADDAYVLFTSESGDILIWDERSDGESANFNGVIVIKADGTVLIGTWEIGPTLEYFVFTEKDGEETFNFLTDEDEGTYELVEA